MKMNLTVPFEKESIVPINLQMFAGTDDQDSRIITEDDEVVVEEDEDLPDEEDDDEVDEKEDEVPGEEEESDEDGDDEADDENEDESDSDSKEEVDKGTEKLQKAENAAIKYKNEAKKLKKELNALRQERQEKLDESEIKKRTAALIEEGHSEESAKKIAKTEVENSAIERKIEINRVMELNGEYPGIEDHAVELVELKRKYPDFSYKELYRARFAEESEYDKKTQMELEITKKRKESEKKSGKDGKRERKSASKLSKEDRELFNYMKKVDPKITVEKFLEVNGSDQIPD